MKIDGDILAALLARDNPAYTKATLFEVWDVLADRWERAKNAEKQAMAKRQAEKEQAAAKKERKSGDGRRVASPSSPDKDKDKGQWSGEEY